MTQKLFPYYTVYDIGRSPYTTTCALGPEEAYATYSTLQEALERLTKMATEQPEILGNDYLMSRLLALSGEEGMAGFSQQEVSAMITGRPDAWSMLTSQNEICNKTLKELSLMWLTWPHARMCFRLSYNGQSYLSGSMSILMLRAEASQFGFMDLV